MTYPDDFSRKKWICRDANWKAVVDPAKTSSPVIATGNVTSARLQVSPIDGSCRKLPIPEKAQRTILTSEFQFSVRLRHPRKLHCDSRSERRSRDLQGTGGTIMPFVPCRSPTRRRCVRFMNRAVIYMRVQYITSGPSRQYPVCALATSGQSLVVGIHGRVTQEETNMKRHLPAGDAGEDRKAVRKELIEAKAMLGKLVSGHADKILKKPRKEAPISVPALQGGRPESKRRKF